uniref:Uncharacterized protein n=1 Tax=Anguilla anguilla TaxID=7936 RepID=A0A0E9Q7M4_ANGAN
MGTVVCFSIRFKLLNPVKLTLVYVLEDCLLCPCVLSGRIQLNTLMQTLPLAKCALNNKLTF